MSHYRCEERSGHVKKRMKQLTTINSTLLFKYTCAVCMCHEEIHAQKWDMYKHNIIRITHVCCVLYTALDLLHVVHRTETWSNKYGVLRRKVASSPGSRSPPHQRTLILDLCTRRKVRRGRAWYVKSQA